MKMFYVEGSMFGGVISPISEPLLVTDFRPPLCPGMREVRAPGCGGVGFRPVIVPRQHTRLSGQSGIPLKYPQNSNSVNHY